MANQETTTPQPVEVPVGGEILTFGSWEQAVDYFTVEAVEAAGPPPSLAQVDPAEYLLAQAERRETAADRAAAKLEPGLTIGYLPSNDPEVDGSYVVEDGLIVSPRFSKRERAAEAAKERAFKAGRAAAWMETPYAEPSRGWDNELRQAWYAGYREGTTKAQAARNALVNA